VGHCTHRLRKNCPGLPRANATAPRGQTCYWLDWRLWQPCCLQQQQPRRDFTTEHTLGACSLQKHCRLLLLLLLLPSSGVSHIRMPDTVIQTPSSCRREVGVPRHLLPCQTGSALHDRGGGKERERETCVHVCMHAYVCVRRIQSQIIGWLGLEGILQIILFHPPAMGRHPVH